jgi:threonine dehydratase
LIAGLAAYCKYLNPKIRIIGVEPWDSDAMTRSVQAGHAVTLDEVGVFADGVAVKQVGALTLACAREFVDDFVRVSTDEICSAIHDIYRETRTIVEPAGALSWAGAKLYTKEKQLQGQKIATINSGANMNFQRLPFAAARALTGAGLETLVAIRLTEKRGALKEFCQKILMGKAITEFNYRSSGANDAYIFLGLATPAPSDREGLHQRLESEGYWFCDLTGNELAKEHVRHMVGGYGHGLVREELYSFSFPEREGALAKFLAVMSHRWNISLFHYRSHGSDFGRVLMAFELDGNERRDCEQQLRDVGYSFTRETLNPAYELFLRPAGATNDFDPLQVKRPEALNLPL